MCIEWEDDLATGIDKIDNQHRVIFTRFAQFSSACVEGVAGDELVRLFKFLEGYTAVHFREEVEAMAGAKYPQIAAQETAHAAFLEEFARLRGLVEENGPVIENILNAKRAMIQWLINHIRHMDKAFADYLLATTRLPPPAPHPA
jgi:hemerythrin